MNEWFDKNLTETQLETLKAMKLRGRPAPVCNGVIFVNGFTSRYTDVLELERRGLMYQEDPKDDMLMYNITSDGWKLANKLLKVNKK